MLNPLSLDFLDLQVRGLGRSVGDTAGVEVARQFLPPGVDRLGEAEQFGMLVPAPCMAVRVGEQQLLVAALVEWVEAERDRLADLLVAAAAAELDQAFAH